MILKDFGIDIGIVSFMAYPEIVKEEELVEEKIKKIVSDDFFSFIEIAHINDVNIRAKVRDVLEISNIRIGFDAHPQILSDSLSINTLDENKRNSALEFFKELIDEAYFMNAEGFTILSGLKPDKKDIENELETAVNSVKELCRYSVLKAKELGRKPVDIIIETFDDKEFAKNRLIGPTDIAVNFAHQIKKEYDNFGLLLDLSHLPILGENFIESLNKAKEFIKHIHIGNCIIKDKSHPAFGDNHPRFCVAGGENDIDILASFIKALVMIGYFEKPNSTLIIEVKPLPGEDPDLTVAGSKRALLRAFNMI